MISTWQILLAGVLTAVAVGVAAHFAQWRPGVTAAAAILAGVAVIVWRAASNFLQLNGDLIPAVSVADVGCLLAGAIGPGAVAVSSRSTRLAWLPATVGAVAGFAVNVVVL